MKKKLTWAMIVVLTLICALTLAACGTSSTAAGDNSSDQSNNIDGETVYITAYDLAVRNGFVGTEQQWLDSLKGEDGKDGKDGEDGVAMFTVSDLYDAAVLNGYTGTFLEFVKEYLGNTSTTSDVTLAVNKGLLSAVSVIATFSITPYYSYSNGRMVQVDKESSGGAGVIYQIDKESGDAYVLTNFHIVYNADSTSENKFSQNVTLYLYGSETSGMGISATVLGGSAYYDVAVLKVTGSEILKNSDARACEIKEGDVVVGQTAIAIGYPAAEGISATSGIVSVDNEYISLNIEGNNIYKTREYRVDAAINSGNSGGGVYNDEGKLIGIVNARHNDSSAETIENIGYVIPISIVTGVADNVIDNCNGEDKVGVYKCMLGVTTNVPEEESKAVYDAETGLTSIVQKIVVTEITEGGLVEGKLQVGDVITGAKIGSETITATRGYHLSEFMLTARVGDTVTIYYTRDGEAGSFDVTLTEECVTVYYTK